MNKKALSERDICTKFITPALTAGNKWDLMSQIREEVYFTKGRVIVRGKCSTRGEAKRADYILSYKPGMGGKPSVFQVRARDVSPDHLGPLAIQTLRQFSAELQSGALVPVDEARQRVRLNQPQTISTVFTWCGSIVQPATCERR